MEELIEQLKKHKENELKDLKKDKSKGVPVRLNSKSYYAKEIEYQTLILKSIQNDLREIKRLLEK